jgi:hypothetical protein
MLTLDLNEPAWEDDMDLVDLAKASPFKEASLRNFCSPFGKSIFMNSATAPKVSCNSFQALMSVVQHHAEYLGGQEFTSFIFKIISGLHQNT